MKIGLINQGGDNHIAIGIGHLLDSVSLEDRKQLTIWFAEDEVYLETVCRAVATPEQDAAMETDHCHDTWFPDSTKTALRLALAPLLSAAVADELQAAVAKAERYERAYRILESLDHINQMWREATEFDDRRRRGEQWNDQWNDVDAMFPQYAAPTAKSPVETSNDNG